MAVDALTCANLAKLTVVSHRGASGAPTDPPIVTEHALHSLRRAGVHSVDFDVFWTRDDTAHVAHPSGLLPLLPRGVRSAFELTDAGAAALPAGPLLRVPRLLALVRDLNLTISLDLKGGEREGYMRQLSLMARQVAAARLQHRVLIWARSRFEVDTLRRRIASSFGKQQAVRALRFAKPLLDVEAPQDPAGHPQCASMIHKGDERAFTSLGPSDSCANAQLFLSDAAAPWRGSSERHWMVWVVDDVRRMAELARYGVRHLISNNPRKMEVARQQLLHRCPNA